jgi:hypothetical protein
MVVQTVDISSASSSRLNPPPPQLTSAFLNQCSSQKHVWLSVLQLAERKCESLSSALQCWIARHFTHSLQQVGRFTVTLQCHCHFTAPLSLYSVTVTLQCHCYFAVSLLLYSATVTLQCHALPRCDVRWALIATDITSAAPAYTVWRIALKLVNKCGSSTNKFISAYKYSVAGIIIIIPRLFVKNTLPNFNKIRERV